MPWIYLYSDGDTGHGNVINVARTVREFEKAGAAGMFIEDQVFPKRCGHMEGKQIISLEEMVPKIKAAVDARHDQDFVVMARTDARAVYGIEDAIERSNKYRDAGADLIFVEAPISREEMVRINSEIDAPTMAIQVEGGKTPLFNAKELEEMGYNVVVFPISTLYAAAWAVKKAMERLKTSGTTRELMDRMITFDSFNELIGLKEIREKEVYYYRGVSY